MTNNILNGFSCSQSYKVQLLNHENYSCRNSKFVNNMINKLISQIKQDPNKIFVFDGMGAIISALFLFTLTFFVNYFGIPKETLYLLASLPIFFALINLLGFYSKENHQRLLLKLIIFFNILYCLISIFFVWLHHDVITILGYIYVIIEILIIAIVVYVEFIILPDL